MAIQIQFRGGTAAEWAAENPVLAVRELAIETDTRKFKIGDGATAWNTLSYATQGEMGPKGDTGDPGPGLEYIWNGTQLGVRVAGTEPYTYVDLKGAQGAKGDKGDTGPKGDTGDSGPGLEFVWNGTQLGVRVPGTGSYTYMDLVGPAATVEVATESAVGGILSGGDVQVGGTGAVTVKKIDGRTLHISASEPTSIDGADGDLWFVYTP